MVNKCVICGINDSSGICLNCRSIDTFNKIMMKSPERIKVILVKLEKDFVRVRVGVVRNAVSQSIENSS